MSLRVGVVPASGAGQATMAATGQLARLHRHFNAYLDAGHELTYFSGCPDDPPWSGVDVRRARWGLPDRTTAILRPILEPRAFRQCDVLRATSLLGALTCLVAHRIHGLPFVVSHGAHYEEIAVLHDHRHQVKKWRWLRRLAFRYAKTVIVPNPVDAVALRRDFPRTRIRWIPNWVDPDLFSPVDVRCARQIYPARVLTVGRLVVEKNLERLARVVRALGAKLVSVGAGPVTPALRRLGVQTPGPVSWPDLPLWHRQAWVYAAPALTEGHPKALLEAMSSGLPCAVSTAIRGIVRDEETALMFDPENEGQMQAQLGRLLRDDGLAVRLGANARKEVLQYDYRMILQQEIRVMEEACSGYDRRAAMCDCGSAGPDHAPACAFRRWHDAVDAFANRERR